MFIPTFQTTPANPPFSLLSIIETLLFVRLREELDADTSGDKSDGAYDYGL